MSRQKLILTSSSVPTKPHAVQTGAGPVLHAPMWAGYMALVNQQALANGQPTIGFLNPAIYSMGLRSAYNAAFHDIISGSNGYPAVTGYDLATGWGSPNGTGLINALAGRPTGGPTPTPAPTPRPTATPTPLPTATPTPQPTATPRPTATPTPPPAPQ